MAKNGGVEQLQQFVNGIYQKRDISFTNGKSLLDIHNLPDGYYDINGSTTDGPSNFGGWGYIEKKTVGGNEYVTLTQNWADQPMWKNVWRVVAQGWNGWNQIN